MPRFRERRNAPSKRIESLDQARDLIAAVLQPAHFFVDRRLTLRWEYVPDEEVPWEVFRGRLLDPAQTRATQEFEAWNIYEIDGGQRSAEPLLSVKLDAAGHCLHVTRAILCHAWEPYDSGDNVILSRETARWVRELTGTIHLDDFTDEDDLRDELAGRVFQAVVGTSRLPLTSVEAPLPAFALGRLGFFDLDAPASPALENWPELIVAGLQADLGHHELAKLLETVLRTIDPPEGAEAARVFGGQWQKHRGRDSSILGALLRTLFNDVSLSPYTQFVDSALAFVAGLVASGHFTIEEHADFLSYLLRQLGRHLTAYDLITFHQRGANYPDALLLDAALRAYLRLIEDRPGLFAGEDQGGRLRRRALRQACLLRRYYEGHLVPDAPTSPGENVRVLPAPHVRVPEEQLLNPLRRTRHLYDGEPLAGLLAAGSRSLLQHGVADLNEAEALYELGTAVFIDRPFGTGKAAGEPDQTLLLSHEAFSRSIAARRLRELADLTTFEHERTQARLEQLASPGLPVQRLNCPQRTVVSLADARRVAEDFVLRRTLRVGVRQFLDLYDWQSLTERYALDFLNANDVRLIVSDAPLVALYDAAYTRRLELTFDSGQGYRTRGGIEFPASGLRVERIWHNEGTEIAAHGVVHVRP